MFDLLYLNGKAFVKEPLIKRRNLLRENFHEVEGEFKFATSNDTSTMEEVQVFLDESVKGNFFFFDTTALAKNIPFVSSVRRLLMSRTATMSPISWH
jgi:hypothetical protein